MLNNYRRMKKTTEMNVSRREASISNVKSPKSSKFSGLPDQSDKNGGLGGDFSMYICIYVYVYVYRRLWGGVSPTGQSFRFVRACVRAVWL